MRFLIAFVALLACLSVVYGGIQAAGTLFDVTDTTVAFLPPDLATPALGVTFLCLSILSGMGYLEAEGYIPLQARVFELDNTKTERLQKLMVWCLGLSILATFFVFLERKMYILNPDSPLTISLQLLTFALIGVLLPLISLFAWFLVAVGLEALISL